jgi:hypothetical protein
VPPAGALIDRAGSRGVASAAGVSTTHANFIVNEAAPGRRCLRDPGCARAPDDSDPAARGDQPLVDSTSAVMPSLLIEGGGRGGWPWKEQERRAPAARGVPANAGRVRPVERPAHRRRRGDGAAAAGPRGRGRRHRHQTLRVRCGVERDADPTWLDAWRLRPSWGHAGPSAQRGAPPGAFTMRHGVQSTWAPLAMGARREGDRLERRTPCGASAYSRGVATGPKQRASAPPRGAPDLGMPPGAASSSCASSCARWGPACRASTPVRPGARGLQNTHQRTGTHRREPTVVAAVTGGAIESGARAWTWRWWRRCCPPAVRAPG